MPVEPVLPLLRVEAPVREVPEVERPEVEVERPVAEVEPLPLVIEPDVEPLIEPVPLFVEPLFIEPEFIVPLVEPIEPLLFEVVFVVLWPLPPIAAVLSTAPPALVPDVPLTLVVLLPPDVKFEPPL